MGSLGGVRPAVSSSTVCALSRDVTGHEQPACSFKSRWVRESQRAAHPRQAGLRPARSPLPAWVARVERAAPLVLDLAALALLALALVVVALLALALVVGRFPQRVVRALAVAVAVVALFLQRLLLARALASRQPSMAAPDSATE